MFASPVFEWLRDFKRDELREQPFPEEWLPIVDEAVVDFDKLSKKEREQLQGDILVFLGTKEFEGCAGLEVTDTMKLFVASQACLLLLNRETRVYPGLKTILMYPEAYEAPSKEVLPGGVVAEGTQARLGESWTRGHVVLSWDDVKRGAADVNDGHNVVLHEFAHQLDQQSGDANGTPVLKARSHYLAWGRVFSEDYLALREATEKGKATFLDKYGATNEAEFFAVATEFFFERPKKLKEKHPELYAELMGYYQQDPANR